MERKKVRLVSLGCPKNLVDSEIILGTLVKNNFEITDRDEEAEIIVINTCGFIKDAKQESIDTILEMADLKNTGRCRLLAVAGCLPERYKNEIMDEMPEVDLWIGSGEYGKIHKLISSGNEGLFLGEGHSDDLFSNRMLSTPRHTAYIKIAEGCSHHCTFCAIPAIKGRYRSRRPEAIIRETEDLVSKGLKEAVLLPQDTTSYGSDLNMGLALKDLLVKMAAIGGLEWIRILYAYPQFITDGMIEVLKNEEKVLKYLDIPVQHISDRILKDMGRGITGDHLRRTLFKLKENVPGLTIRTSVIVGFPGETESEFSELLNFIGEFQFDRLGAFMYSSEEGTPASEMGGMVSEKIKKDRYKKVMSIQKKISRNKNRELIGRIEKVLVDGICDDDGFVMTGRTSGQAPEIDGLTYIASCNASPGEIIDVRITNAEDYDLAGEDIAAGE